MSKILVRNETNICLYEWPDTYEIYQTANETSVVIDGVRYEIISDCNTSNTTYYEEITNTPDDWAGHKYLFDGANWTANPDYVEPSNIEEP